MDHLSYASYEALTKVPVERMLDLDVIGAQDRTLTLGYDLDRKTVHVYALDGEIHFHRYRRAHALTELTGKDFITLEHAHADQLPVSELRPTKRSFPERTDWAFAVRMHVLGQPLSFTTFNDEALAAAEGQTFYGAVA